MRIRTSLRGVHLTFLKYNVELFQTYPEIVVSDVEVGETTWEDKVGGEGTLDAELDLAAVGLEPVADLKADATNDHSDQMFDLQKQIIVIHKSSYDRYYHSCFLVLQLVLTKLVYNELILTILKRNIIERH